MLRERVAARAAGARATGIAIVISDIGTRNRSEPGVMFPNSLSAGPTVNGATSIA